MFFESKKMKKIIATVAGMSIIATTMLSSLVTAQAAPYYNEVTGNLLQNSSFEETVWDSTGTTAWQVNASVIPQRTPGESIEGDHSCMFSRTSAKNVWNNHGIRQGIELKAGVDYFVSCWVKSSPETPVTRAQIRMREDGAGGSWEFGPSTGCSPNPDNWTRMFSVFKVPADKKYQLQIGFPDAGSKVGDKLYVDKVILGEVNDVAKKGVAIAEANPTLENIENAQTYITGIRSSSETLQKDLQKRLDAVKVSYDGNMAINGGFEDNYKTGPKEIKGWIANGTGERSVVAVNGKDEVYDGQTAIKVFCSVHSNPKIQYGVGAKMTDNKSLHFEAGKSYLVSSWVKHDMGKDIKFQNWLRCDAPNKWIALGSSTTVPSGVWTQVIGRFDCDTTSDYSLQVSVNSSDKQLEVPNTFYVDKVMVGEAYDVIEKAVLKAEVSKAKYFVEAANGYITGLSNEDAKKAEYIERMNKLAGLIINTPFLKTKSGKPVDYSNPVFDENDSVFAYVKAYNNQEDFPEVALAFAVYDAQGRIVNVAFSEADAMPLDVGEERVISTSGISTKGFAEGMYAKAFVVDNFMNFKPLNNATLFFK